jgi:chromosome segregation ATPase
MSLSEFIQAMTEAGIKKFDARVEPDETNRELREQRNDLKAELDRARERIDKLEERLLTDERAAVREHVEDNPGADFQSILEHVRDTAPKRVNKHLDTLEGEAISAANGHYHPIENGEEGV